jgi:hypothetical protein
MCQVKCRRNTEFPAGVTWHGACSTRRMLWSGPWALVQRLVVSGCVGACLGCGATHGSSEAAGAGTSGGGMLGTVGGGASGSNSNDSGGGGANGGTSNNSGGGGANGGTSNNSGGGGTGSGCFRASGSTCGNVQPLAGEACELEGFACYREIGMPCEVQNYYIAFSCCCGRWVFNTGNGPSQSVSCEQRAVGSAGGTFVDCNAGGAGGESAGGAGGADGP